MNKAAIIFLFGAASLTVGCGSQPAMNSDNAIAVNVNSVASANTEQSTANSPVGQPAGIPDSSEAVKPVDTNTEMSSKGNVNAQTRKVVDGPADPNIKPSEIPAAENSTMSTAMGSGGSFIEIRTFKSDPQIRRVQKVLNGPSIGLTIELRNGRRVSVPIGKVPALNTITVEELKSLAGIVRPSQPAAPETGAKTGKKD